jgi:hypothetical protein
MSQPSWPRIFAARILEPMDAFRPGTLPDAPIAPDEEPIGVYDNGEPAALDAVLVTTRALHIQRAGGWESARFVEITGVDTEPEVHTGSDKLAVWALRLTLADGRSIELPVRGRRDRFRDAFEFLRFLRNVLDEAKSAVP